MSDPNPYEWREPGQALWPENKSFSVENLRRIQASAGVRDWEALYQGRPTPAKGVIFGKEQFGYWLPYKSRDKPPPVRVEGREQPQPLIELPHESEWGSMTLAGDLTFKKKDDSDFVALGVWMSYKNKEFLLDQVVGRKGFSDTLKAIVSLLQKWPRINAVLIEDAANGPAIIETLRAHVPGVIPRSAAGGKEARAYAVQPRFEAGDIFLPHPTRVPWVADYVAEMVRFPQGKNDDQVDQTTHYLAWRTENKGGLDRLLALVQS